MGIFNLFGKKENTADPAADKDALDRGLNKTREGLLGRLGRALAGKSTIDDDFLDELEEILISSDVGIDTTVRIINRLKDRVSRDKYLNIAELNSVLRDEISSMLSENRKDTLPGFTIPERRPYVIMVVGVNGVGKTTTIGKLAWRFTQNGYKVVIGAADTFRAAAVDQLGEWARRSGVEMISHGMNTDPASVAFDAVKHGIEKSADVVIVDTAGRLHNKVGLMNELSKIRRVMQKHGEQYPDEVLLVLDGSTGQNAFEQARQFTAATQVSALAITKLDGTAKGGVVLGISDQFHIPVKYIGLGEGIEDLRAFDAEAFTRTLFGEGNQ